MSIARRLFGVAVVAPFLCLACHHDDADDNKSLQGANMAPRDTARPLGPGDVRIANADSSFELAMIGDSIVTGFGNKVLDKVRGKTDTAAVSGNGFAASIEKTVKSSIATAMGSELRFPISDVSDVRYANGELQFFGKDGSRMPLFQNSRENGKQASTTFREEDAQRFIAAFKARKSGGR